MEFGSLNINIHLMIKKTVSSDNFQTENMEHSLINSFGNYKIKEHCRS